MPRTANPKGRPLPVSGPSDQERRDQLVAAMLRPAAAPSPAAPPPQGPALQALPPAARPLCLIPSARYRHSAEAMISACVTLDMAPLSPGQRLQLNIPQAAAAPFVTATQMRTLGWLAPGLRARFPWQPEWQKEQLGKYRELMNAVPYAQSYVSAVGTCRLAVLAARAAAQGLLDGYLDRELQRLPETDPRYAELWARREVLRGLSARAAQRDEAQDRKRTTLREQSLALLAEVQGEHQLADVWEKLRAGVTPDREALLSAARFFRAREERRKGASPPPALSRAPGQDPARVAAKETRRRPR